MKRINNDMFRQLEDLKIKNEMVLAENRILKVENCDVRAENGRMLNHIDELEMTLEERIQKAVEEAVSKAVEPLQAATASKRFSIIAKRVRKSRADNTVIKVQGLTYRNIWMS